MSPSSLDPRSVVPYRRRARAILFVGVLFLSAGIGGLLNPHDVGESIVARELTSAAQTVWLALFAIGGLLVVLGIRWPGCPRPELEVLGLWPLIGGSSINLLTIVVSRGPIPPPAVMTTVVLLGLAIWTLHGRVMDLEDALDRREHDAAEFDPDDDVIRPSFDRRRRRAQPYSGPERRTPEPPR